MSWRDKIAAVLAGKVGGPTPTGIHVYHSSPHDFDKFDLAKIGTGEGAQVYGHGIYAAENPAVSGQGGQYWNQFSRRFGDDPEGTAASFLALEGFDRDKAIARVKDQVQRNREFHKTAYMPPDERADAIARNARLEESFRLLESGAPVGPRTYEVNFRAKPEELLDWDKPVGQQPRIVDAFRQLGYKEAPQPYSDKLVADVGGFLDLRSSGEDAYRTAVRHAADRYGHTDRGTNARYASETLGEAGVPGIRYLDEGSRLMPQRREALENTLKIHRADGKLADVAEYENLLANMKPTHNYVAFDPSKLDIMAKYGVVGATGGVPLGAATMGGTIDQSTYGARQ